MWGNTLSTRQSQGVVFLYPASQSHPHLRFQHLEPAFPISNHWCLWCVITSLKYVNLATALPNHLFYAGQGTFGCYCSLTPERRAEYPYCALNTIPKSLPSPLPSHPKPSYPLCRVVCALILQPTGQVLGTNLNDTKSNHLLWARATQATPR